MLKELLIGGCKWKTKPGALLLSGGVDSISIGLAAHHAGKTVHAYSFHLDTHESYDFQKAREVSEIMGWEFTSIVVPTNNIESDFKYLAQKGCRKKTHFECVFPFLYVYDYITEKHVLTGWGADGYFGVSKKANMRYGSIKQQENYKRYCIEHNMKQETFDQFRDNYFLPENTAGLQAHKLISDHRGKVLINPYLDPKVKEFFYNKTWKELNKPVQKHHIRNAFDEFKKFGKIKNHQNLHLAAGVDKVFETLLNNKKINFRNRKRVMDVCKDWSNGILDI